jgi:hypothetical protein
LSRTCWTATPLGQSTARCHLCSLPFAPLPSYSRGSGRRLRGSRRSAGLPLIQLRTRGKGRFRTWGTLRASISAGR